MLLGLAGCATSGGVAVEGAAEQVKPPPTAPAPPSGTPPSVDAVALLRADQNVPDKIKQQLVPCAGGQYPINERYADLTGDGLAELMVSVQSCLYQEPAPVEKVPGYAGYVYSLESDPPTRIFAAEEGGVELLAAGGGLTVIHGRGVTASDVCCPSEKYTFYEWNGTEFVVTRR